MTFRFRLFRKMIVASLIVIMLIVALLLRVTLNPHLSKAAPMSNTLYSWGWNINGQLGNGTTTNSPIPLLVNLPDGVAPTVLAGGYNHSLVTGSDGKLYAWGLNSDGQLGDGTTTERDNPIVVNLPAGVTPTALAAGGAHSLAIGTNGNLYAWGNNQFGQLGNGATTNSTTPILINLPNGAKPLAISAGRFHSLAIGNDGNLYTWGANFSGQLGNGTTTNSTTPILINLAAGVTPTAIAGGEAHSLAIGNNGKLYVWGNNSYGQLGDGTTTDRATPVVVALPAGITPTAIGAGIAHSIAKGSNGKVYAWGTNNYGNLGDGTSTNSATPVLVNLPAGVSAVTISTSDDHSMAIGNDGKLYAWGLNDLGELGDGTYIDKNTPVLVALPTGVTPLGIVAGEGHNLAILPPPTIAINNVTQAEGNAGPTNFNFTVTLAYATNSTVSVNYATANGTATAPSDYTATSGILTFSPGITTQTVIVPVVGDVTAEADETFTVNLTNLVNATLATATGTGTILNDDAAPGGSVTLLSSTPNPSTVGQAVTFAVKLTPVNATGTVTLTEGATVLGVATVSGGMANFTISDLSVGSHNITAQYSGNATYTGSTSNTVIQVVNPVVTPPPPVKQVNRDSADLIAKLRVSPDREFGLNVNGDNTLVYSLTVKNVGPGKANNISVQFPIDPELVVGYMSSNASDVWVEQIVTDTDTPYIVISVPPLENNASRSFTIAMRASSAATVGSSLFTTYKVWWDDAQANHRSQHSNGVRIALTNGTGNRNDTDGAVQFYKLSSDDKGIVTIIGDFYAPGESLVMWYTDAANQSIGLRQYQADPSGVVTATVDVSNWAVGSYVIAGHGQRSEITGAVAITISAATNSSQPRSIAVKELNSTTMNSFFKSWSGSK